MKRLTIISLHPQVIEAYAAFGPWKRALSQGLLELRLLNLRDFAVDRHGSVDSRPYGGGDGMVLRPEPLKAALDSLGPGPKKVIFTSPHGKSFTQSDARFLAETEEDLVFICGRFGGVDQRFLDLYVDLDYSLGDFVISGGELPVMTMIDAALRLIPGSLGSSESAKFDSFGEAHPEHLEHPLFSKPPLFQGLEVPQVLLSGNHEAIAQWKKSHLRAARKS